MFLGSYAFDGDTAELLPAYDRLVALLPPSQISLHVCVTRDGGITVFDACPDRATFAGFSTSDDFANALAGVGLPTPRVEQLGDVYAAKLRS